MTTAALEEARSILAMSVEELRENQEVSRGLLTIVNDLASVVVFLTQRVDELEGKR